MDITKATLDPKAVQRIARKLQVRHAKETLGDVKPWAELVQREQKLWLRLGERAATATIQELTALSTRRAS